MSIADPSRRGSSVDRATPRPPAKPELPRATMDIRLPWPLGRTMILAALLVGFGFGFLTSTLGTAVYKGELQLLVLKLNNPSPTKGIEIIDRRVTAITAIARSENFLVELQRETGVDVSIAELGKMVEATRPNFGAIAEITVTGKDEALVTTLTEHLPTAMSSVVDRVRSGSGDIVAGNGANVGVGDDPDYRGPLYLELFTDLSDGQATSVGFTEPRVTMNVMLGMLFGVFVTAAYGAIAHERSRTTTQEDLEVLLDVEQFASVPRPGWRSGKGRSPRLMMGFANEVAAVATDERFAVGYAGTGTRRLRRRFVRCMATSTAAVTGQPVVVVDLDHEPRGPLASMRRRPGLLDVDPADGSPMPLRPLSRWQLPRWAARLGVGVPISQVGLGSVPDESVDVDERLAAAVMALTTDHVVLVNFPRIPGPIAIGSALGALDVAVLVLLDGWTPLDNARVVADALSAGTPGPVGSVVIEN
jgi:capsular polysaccharide biosynthesis protein